jgi:hypothetical protein
MQHGFIKKTKESKELCKEDFPTFDVLHCKKIVLFEITQLRAELF